MVSFIDTMMEPNNNALIVDSLNLAFRWKHNGDRDFRHSMVKTVQSLAQSYECSRVIITGDQGKSSMRLEESPEYKGNRKDLYKDQTEAEKEDIRLFFEEYEAALTLLSKKYPIIRKDKVEADDLAAYICKHRVRLGIDNIWLISSDKDWDLLINENVSRFSTVTRKESTFYNWAEFYNFPIEKYISFKVLTGDKGDNVPGIAGIGPVRASALLEQYDSAFDIYDSMPLEGTYKFIQSLNESGDLILTNYKMMDLLSYCEDAIVHPGHSLTELDESIKGYMNAN